MSQPTIVTIPGVSTVLPSSERSAPVLPSSRSLLVDLPIPTNVPAGLQGDFESPHLIVPIDKADPAKIIGNGYTAQLSSTVSTVLIFDIRPEHQGKTCNLMFYDPPLASPADAAAFHIRAPGGINVSRLTNNVASPNISASGVGSSTPVGVVPSVQPANQYIVSSAPCDAGQRVGYQVDAFGGLNMDFFQMTFPPLGLFVVPV